jgi:hypothetical protein
MAAVFTDGGLVPGIGIFSGADPLAVSPVSPSNPLPIADGGAADSLTTTNSVTSAATVVSVPTAGFGGGAFHVTNAGVGCTVSYEQSNDGVNWVTLPVQNGVVTSLSVGFFSTTTAGIICFSSAAAYIRARVSTYGSGTVTISLTQKRVVPPLLGPTLSSGGNNIGNVNVSTGYTDSTTALGASASFTGTSRGINGNQQYSFFNAFAFADQAGTLYIDVSLDTGATFQQVASVAVAANAGQALTTRLVGQFTAATLYRVRFVNGATAQGTFRIASSLTAN